MRYRTDRYVIDGPRGRDGEHPAPLRLVPASPIPQIDWEDAVRRIACIRRGQMGLMAVVGLLTVAGPVAVASLHWSHALSVVAVASALVAVALVAWAVLDRSLRGVVGGLGQSARVLAGLAATDPLTELPNHRAFQERLQEESASALRAGRPLSLVLIDLDHFKRVNDTHGHPAGDKVVREVARRLSACSRQGEMVARIGGEEFAWLLPGDAMDAWQAAERARLTVESTAVITGVRLTISAGVCELGQAGSPMELVRLADGALYWAKAHGRNRCIRYSPGVVEELSADERARDLPRGVPRPVLARVRRCPAAAVAVGRRLGPRARRRRPPGARADAVPRRRRHDGLAPSRRADRLGIGPRLPRPDDLRRRARPHLERHPSGASRSSEPARPPARRRASERRKTAAASRLASSSALRLPAWRR